ncbi:MAG: hypothetical protein COY38_00515 [Candidatus Aenigmarchaeota archaeon CG_4_10_14_0_8_um_filter_37_24]|nr:MAG: hypothetical protein COS07_04255 [Candidatus Aenigmarchaeota archaeon CG01_land_8_20_14_3_00_37_9]PIX50294.1 MAG: hypothetical protein COZ52_04700 [Candidatus Aenigmarchaeota archaeon CG_4_8_14_3_um_filter_37_24]PIZ36290.1 MAG: hypothetical protein COY38_00515 [Candidatus Aenigmarchaeota archaeon CG_4_10_14_0_8_um_filter_37_24]PJB74006.1 MAG: hypothetical protein CO092_05635 [Candidatus Aenigmarchaeota archaeon CG_4_9_14_3_um_filter_37_18]
MFKRGVGMSILVLILISVSLGAVGQSLLKYGLDSMGKLVLKDLLVLKNLISFATNIFIIGGLSLYVLATGIWFVVLSNADISYAYPLVSLGYIITAVIGRFVFNENLTVMRITGIGLIIAGAYLVGSKI